MELLRRRESLYIWYKTISISEEEQKIVQTPNKAQLLQLSGVALFFEIVVIYC